MNTEFNPPADRASLQERVAELIEDVNHDFQNVVAQIGDYHNATREEKDRLLDEAAKIQNALRQRIPCPPVDYERRRRTDSRRSWR